MSSLLLNPSQLNQSEYLHQFDTLKFDKKQKPVSINQPTNPALARDINFQNGYSEFQNTNMHYGVVPQEQFVHNMMAKWTSRRDVMKNMDNNSRKYEELSGNNSEWRHKKEVEPFYVPVKDLTYVHGAPSQIGNLANRYIASFKNNNGNLPFKTDVKVLPGIDGKNSAPYAVVRVEPRNIDELRSEINRKTVGLNKPLETIKKGELRGMESEITSWKTSPYRENFTSDFVPNKHYVDGIKQTGKIVHSETDRGTNNKTQIGSGVHDTRQGNAPNNDMSEYTESNKMSYLNDFTHSINAVNTRPVFTNAQSYTNYQTDREEISRQIIASGIHNNSASYHKNEYEIAKPTMKESLIDNKYQGILHGVNENKSYVLSKDNVIDANNRDTTNYNQPSNITSSYQSIRTNLTDTAKETIKETTSINNYISNIVSNIKSTYSNLTDIAKPTIKQTTEDNNYIGNIGTNTKSTYSNLTDTAKPTIKQTTIINSTNSTITPITSSIIIRNNDIAKKTIKETVNYDQVSNIKPIIQFTTTHFTDLAKPTIKETTENNNYIGIISSDNKESYSSLQDNAKTTIREGTIFATPAKNVVSQVPESYAKNNEEARPTIKETTINLSHNGGMYDANKGYYNINDLAKPTIKQTTLINNYHGSVVSGVNAVRVEEAERNMTIDDKREQTSIINRFANAKSDQIRGNINSETVEFNDKRNLYSYVSNPTSSLNHTATCIDNMTTQNNRKQDPTGNNTYRIDPIFIETLKNNPLVNDLYHQKNIDFNTGK